VTAETRRAALFDRPEQRTTVRHARRHGLIDRRAERRQPAEVVASLELRAAAGETADAGRVHLDAREQERAGDRRAVPVLALLVLLARAIGRLEERAVVAVAGILGLADALRGHGELD